MPVELPRRATPPNPSTTPHEQQDAIEHGFSVYPGQYAFEESQELTTWTAVFSHHVYTTVVLPSLFLDLMTKITDI